MSGTLWHEGIRFGGWVGTGRKDGRPAIIGPMIEDISETLFVEVERVKLGVSDSAAKSHRHACNRRTAIPSVVCHRSIEFLTDLFCCLSQ